MARRQATDETLTVQGTTAPRVGFGTWRLSGADAVAGVCDALEIGYRHIDTARMYGNEREVGRAIAESGVPREEIFLVTKIWPDDFAPARLKAAAEDSLRSLGTDRVDLLLLHWPNPDVPLEQTMAAMTELRERGLLRHAGVSNFEPDLVRRAIAVEPVLADQVELHPYLSRGPLLHLAQEEDFTVTAWAPLARGRVARDRVLAEVAEAHGKSPGQVALRWLLDQPMTTVIPKASSHERRAENFAVWDFELSLDERARIAELARG